MYNRRIIKSMSEKTRSLEEEMKAAFKRFQEDESYFKDYDGYDEFIGSKFLVRLFVFTPEKKTKFLDSNGNPIDESQMRSRVLPFAKVIRIGSAVTEEYKNFNVGDVLVVGEDIGGSMVNPAFIDWVEAQKEKPPPKTERPAALIGRITQWSDYVFVADRLKERITREDAFTFFAPQSKFCTKWKR